MRRAGFAGLLFAVAVSLAGCFRGAGPFLDEKNGLVDTYFVGNFTYPDPVGGGTRRLQVHLQGNRYVIEDNEAPFGVVTAKRFRGDLFVAQLKAAKRLVGRTTSSYAYMLVRKTDFGFEISKPCSGAESNCYARTRGDLTHRLDNLANSLQTNHQEWISIRRAGPPPVGAVISKSESPS